LCKVYEAQGDFTGFTTTAQRQIAALDESGGLYDLFDAFVNVGGSALMVGKYAEAEQAALAGLQAVEKLHAPGWEIHIVSFYSWVLLQQGRWAELLDWSDRILPNFQRVGCDPCFASIFGHTAEIEGKRGNPDQVRKYIDYGLTVWQQLDRPIRTTQWRFFAHAFLEEWEPAWALVEEAGAKDQVQLGSFPFSLYMWSMLVPEVAARRGQWSQAASLAREALALFKQPELPVGMAHGHFALGLAHAGQKAWDEALNEYEQVLTRFRTLGHTWDVANTQYEMGLVYSARRQAGDLDKGRELFDQALVAFRDLGAKPGIAKAEAALERLG
jgi:tetratricopeptide (TPR) repeat protein